MNGDNYFKQILSLNNTNTKSLRYFSNCRPGVLLYLGVRTERASPKESNRRNFDTFPLAYLPTRKEPTEHYVHYKNKKPAFI